MEEITFDMDPSKAKADLSDEDGKKSPSKDKDSMDAKKMDDTITKLQNIEDVENGQLRVSEKVKSVQGKGETAAKSTNVKTYLIGLTIAVVVIAVVAIIVVYATAGCDQEWQKSEGGTCVSRCSDGVSTWDGSKCVKCAES